MFAPAHWVTRAPSAKQDPARRALPGKLGEGGLQSSHATDTLVVDEHLRHLSNGRAASFVEGHALGFVVNPNFFIGKRAGLQKHLG
jgi:hypothetical protein